MRTNKKLIKFVVFVITILTANLLGDYAGDFLTSFKDDYKPLTFTLVAMVVIVLIFYPLFDSLEDWVTKFSNKIVKHGAKNFGPNVAILMIFLVSMIVLIFFYTRQYYEINVFHHLFRGHFDNLF
jgi:H+/Cl- antiporter ClcA